MGPSPKHFQVRDFILLVNDGSLCTSEYCPNSILQWGLKSKFCPSRISRGEYTLDIPVFSGKLLDHSAVKYTNLMITCLGSALNDSVFIVICPRYFTALISLLIYPISSLAAFVLTFLCVMLAGPGSNSMSINRTSIF